MKNLVNLFFFVIILIIKTSIIYPDEFPSVKYVTSREGLIQRESPNVSSIKVGLLLYGTRIIVLEKSIFMETIEGITDYWYKCRIKGFSWVFGGFLSDSIPVDTDPVLGYWNTNRGDREYWDFRPDFTVKFGRKETDIGWNGTWTLYDNKLIIMATPTEFSVGEKLTLEIILTVENKDKIILNFLDGSKEVLTRNNEII